MLKNIILLLTALGSLSLFLIHSFDWSASIVVVVYTVIMMCIVFFVIDHLSNQNREARQELKQKLKVVSSKSTTKDLQWVKLFNILPFPILMIDTFGDITLSNELFHTFHIQSSGYEKETYFQNNYMLELKEFFREAFLFEKQNTKRLYLFDQDFEIVSVPIRINNKFEGCIIYMQDLTEMLEGEKRQKRFIADASHELKTPLSIIKGMVEILQRPEFDDKDVEKDFLEQIASETNRLESIVKDMLLLSKLSNKDLILEKKEDYISTVINQALDLFIPMFDQKGIGVLTKIKDDPKVVYDFDKLSQVLINLLQNAYNYTDQGYLRITTKQQSNNLLLTIEDSGCGIDESYHEQIFERLFRVDHSRTRDSGGSGLGLAISKSIIEAHGGSICVHSKVDQGSTFTITLPL